jgi:hypothetical protein
MMAAKAVMAIKAAWSRFDETVSARNLQVKPFRSSLSLYLRILHGFKVP